MSQYHQSGSPAPALKGATASIFLAMILQPGPQTVKSLQLATGYSFKPVRAALTLLEQEGLIRYEARIFAWVVQSGTPLLNRLRQAMLLTADPWSMASLAPPVENGTAERGADTADCDLSTELSTACQQPTAESPAATEQSPLATGQMPVGPAETLDGPEQSDVAAASADPIQPAVDPAACGKTAARAGESPDGVGESPVAYGESPVRRGKSPPSRAPITTTTANSQNQTDQETASKQKGRKRAQTPTPLPEKRQRVLAAWLIRGGIGPTSVKMRELLAHDLDLAVVKAHVLEREACEAGLVEGRSGYAAGLLIRKLLDGDPPPPLRCEQCLQLPDKLGWCRCDYDSVIKR